MSAKAINPHPILKPGYYRVLGFKYSSMIDASGESAIDLELSKGEKILRLRFTNPTELRIRSSIAGGFENLGIYIDDIQDWQREGVSVKVGDFDDSGESIQFYARNVIDLDDAKC